MNPAPDGARSPLRPGLLGPVALGAAASFSAMLFASRLPPTLDFILPRRPGWALFELGSRLLSRPGGRRAFSAAVLLLLLAALGGFAALAVRSARSDNDPSAHGGEENARRQARGRPLSKGGWRRHFLALWLGRRWRGREAARAGFGLALLAALLFWSFSIWLEFTRRVAFPHGAVNLLEPFAHFTFAAAALLAAGHAALGLLAPRPAFAGRGPAAWAAVNALLSLAAWGLFGVWRALPEPAGPPERRLYLVLSEEQGRPETSAYLVALRAGEQALTRLASSRADARRLPALRRLYELRAQRLDPAGLREALRLGLRQGDGVAASLLLEQLSIAPPSDETRAALAELGDERRRRVGALGAARLALAAAHLGDIAQAERWAAASGRAGLPAGLLGLGQGSVGRFPRADGGGTSSPYGSVAAAAGRVSGRVSGASGLRVGLYRRRDAAAPPLLDASSLVAAAAPDGRGRFSFAGLSPGRYFLALAFADEGPLGELRVLGHRGDIILDGRRRSVELAPLTVKRPTP